MTDTENLKHIELLRRKQLEETKNNLSSREKLCKLEKDLTLLQKEREMLLKCRELFDLWKKDKLNKSECSRLQNLENDNEIMNYLTSSEFPTQKISGD